MPIYLTLLLYLNSSDHQRLSTPIDSNLLYTEDSQMYVFRPSYLRPGAELKSTYLNPVHLFPLMITFSLDTRLRSFQSSLFPVHLLSIFHVITFLQSIPWKYPTPVSPLSAPFHWHHPNLKFHAHILWITAAVFFLICLLSLFFPLLFIWYGTARPTLPEV